MLYNHFMMSGMNLSSIGVNCSSCVFIKKVHWPLSEDLGLNGSQFFALGLTNR